MVAPHIQCNKGQVFNSGQDHSMCSINMGSILSVFTVDIGQMEEEMAIC